MNLSNFQEHWDQQASIYASAEGHHGFGRFLDLYESSCWDYLAPVLPEVDTSTILETGCGTGRWVMRLAPMGYRMVLTDLSPEMIRHAREKVSGAGLGDRVLAYDTLDICDLNSLTDCSFDMVLALGGPLSLCRDANLAIREFRRVTKPGGHILCDAANRYRTGLDLVLANVTDQLPNLLDTGRFFRPDGLSDQRFSPDELAGLFEGNDLEVLHLVGVCPFFSFLPSRASVNIMDDPQVFQRVGEVGRRYAKDSHIISLSGRLLVVARRLGSADS
jgi:SAM-dependent methyltransferase